MAAVIGRYPEFILGFPCFFNYAYSTQLKRGLLSKGPFLPFRVPEALDTIPV
jgi:hypothetical protein